MANRGTEHALYVRKEEFALKLGLIAMIYGGLLIWATKSGMFNTWGLGLFWFWFFSVFVMILIKSAIHALPPVKKL